MKVTKNLIMMITLFLSMAVKAEVGYALAEINLGYGMLDIAAGGGSLNIGVDKNQKITRVGIDALGGVLGFDEHVLASQTLNEMIAGETLNYVMSGAEKPLFKVSALAGFGPYGGPAKISMRNKNGFQSQLVNIARDARSGRYHLFQNNKKIKEIAINLRGYGIPVLYVGWSDLN